MTDQRSDLDFQALFQALPGAFLVLDRDYRIVAMSDAYLEALGGAEREALVGRLLFDLTPEGISDEAKAAFVRLRASFDRVMQSGQSETLPPEPYQARRRRAQGGGLRRGYVSVMNSPLKGPDGAPHYLIHRVHDVTSSETAIRQLDLSESERRSMESRHALALAASGMGAWDYDRRRGELSWDERAKTLLGVPTDQPLSFATFFELVHPDDRATMRALVDEILRPDGPGELTVTYRIIHGGDAAPIWLEARGRGTYIDGECVRVSGVVADVTARQRYEAHLKLLINELNHRVKNTLAVVQSIAMRTLRDGVDPLDARQRFVNRLMALAAAHDILTRENWEGAELSELIRRSLEPFGAVAGGRIEALGPMLRISPKVAVSLALALHELGTNAVKYGALSNTTGIVSLAWGLGDEPRPEFRLTWTERGGPPVKRPERRGLGLSLLERVLAADLAGKVEVLFEPQGLVCHVCAEHDAWRQQDGETLLTV